MHLQAQVHYSHNRVIHVVKIRGAPKIVCAILHTLHDWIIAGLLMGPDGIVFNGRDVGLGLIGILIVFSALLSLQMPINRSSRNA